MNTFSERVGLKKLEAPGSKARQRRDAQSRILFNRKRNLEIGFRGLLDEKRIFSKDFSKAGLCNLRK